MATSMGIMVVQPDLVIVCDAARVDDRDCRGATDLAIEALSTQRTMSPCFTLCLR